MFTCKVSNLILLFILCVIEAQKETSFDETTPVLYDVDDSEKKEDETSVNKEANESINASPNFDHYGNKTTEREFNDRNISSEIKALNNNINEKDRKKEFNEKKQTPISPLVCIKNYTEFCLSKFQEYKFNDGCHDCACNKYNFCNTGQCQYFPESFEKPEEYCLKVKEKNKIDYGKQKFIRILNGKRNESWLTENIKIVKFNKTDNWIKNKTDNTNSNETNQHIESTKNKLDILASFNDPYTRSNETFSEKNIIKNLNSPLGKVEWQQKLNETGKSIIDRNEKLLGKIYKDNPLDKNNTIKGKNDLVNLQSAKVKNAWRKLHPIVSNKTRVFKHPAKITLFKISNHNIIKAMIYQIAKNELAIEKTLKMVKKKSAKYQIRKHILKDLLSIKKKNSKYKNRILHIVKKEMINKKYNLSDSIIGPKDVKTFNKSYKKLIKLHKGLQKIRSKFVKPYNYNYRRKKKYYYGGCEHLKSSLILIFINILFIIMYVIE